MRSNSYLREDEQDEKRKGFKGVGEFKSLIFLFKHATGQWNKLFAAMAFLLLSSSCAILGARYLGHLVQYGLIPLNYQVTIKHVITLLIFEGFSIVFLWAGRRILVSGATAIIVNIRKVLFLHLQKLPAAFFDRVPQGRIITRITHDIEGIEEFFTASLGKIVVAIFTGILAFMAMVIENPFLGTVITVGIIPAILFVALTSKKVTSLNRALGKSSSIVNSTLSEYLNGIEVIRSFGLEDWSMGRYSENVEHQKICHLEANFYYGWTRPLIAFMCMIPFLGLTWFGGKGVLLGTFSLGAFVAFVRYCERFINPILEIAREIHVVQQALTNSERVVTFLRHKVEDDILGKALQDPDLSGEIIFENVTMVYDGSQWPALNNVSFHIKKGEKIGVVGRTGSGKTSTLALLSRLYPFQSGNIILDGIPIIEIERSHLRKKIGSVTQDAILFKGSIRENLTLDLSLPDETILKACDKTGLTSVLKKGSRTLDSLVLENGANLSAGERQLIVITRVFLADPSILIIDEATANIDPYHEKIIHKAVYDLMKGRTCLIVAHRLSTLSECDRLFVFHEGELVEEGTQDELLDQGGHFSILKKGEISFIPTSPS